MATTEKKPNGGYSRLKVKYAKLKAQLTEADEKLATAEAKLKAATEQHSQEIREKDDSIRKQGTKISQLSADLAVAQGNEDEWQRKYNEAVRCMGSLRRWWYGFKTAATTVWV